MDTSFLENYYENSVLPLYPESPQASDITWKDHGKVGPDAWAHYFEDKDGREYVLLYEDFPGGEYLGDGLTHDIITVNGDTSLHVLSPSGKQQDNVYGYFTLLREKLPLWQRMASNKQNHRVACIGLYSDYAHIQNGCRVPGRSE